MITQQPPDEATVSAPAAPAPSAATSLAPAASPPSPATVVAPAASSSPSPSPFRGRGRMFTAVLVATHLLMGGAGYALSVGESSPVATSDAGSRGRATSTPVDDPGGTYGAGGIGAAAGETGPNVDLQSQLVAPLPAGASRFVDTATTRVLDTRGATPVSLGGTVSINLTPHISPRASAIAISVVVMAPLAPGLVTAQLDAGEVTVADMTTPMISNLVFVPRATADDLTVTVEGGGHVVIDVVGYFELSGPAAEGRFVSVAPQPLGRLQTDSQGRQLTLTAADSGALPDEGVGSVMVRIRADVGSEGGQVQLGPRADDLPNLMMWPPTTDGDRNRHGLAIVSLDEAGRFSLDYQGGSELEVDLLGYFTDGGAAVSADGLFVPIPTAIVFNGDIAARTPTEVDVAKSVGDEYDISAVALTIVATAGTPGGLFSYNTESGLPRSTTLDLGGGAARTVATTEPVDSAGTTLLFSEADATINVEATGYFLAGQER